MDHVLTDGRRIIAATYLLGATAYAAPWLAMNPKPIPALAVFGVLLATSIATARARLPTLPSVIGALAVAAIVVGPTQIHVESRPTQMIAGVAFALGIVLARPAAWLARYRDQPSFSCADRISLRAGSWASLVSLPALARAVWLFRANPNRLEWKFDIAVAGVVTFFAIFLALRGALGARARNAWLARVRRGEIPGFRVRPLMDSDPALALFDEALSVRSSGVLEVCSKASLYAESESGRPVALAALR